MSTSAKAQILPRAAALPTDLRRPTRILIASLMPVGPAAVAILRFILPYSDTDSNSTAVAKIATHAGTERAVLWLSVVAMLTLVPGAMAAIKLASRRAPRLAAAAGLLLIPGYLALPAVMLTDNIGIAATAHAVGPATVARIVSLATSQPTTSLLSVVFVAGHLLGTVILSLALWQSKTIPALAAAGLGASQLLHLAAALSGNHPLDLIGWGLTSAGLACAAVTILRLSDDEWEPRALPALIPPQMHEAEARQWARGPQLSRVGHDRR